MQVKFYEKRTNCRAFAYVGSAQHLGGMPTAHTLAPLARALDCRPGKCMAVVDEVEVLPFILPRG